MAATNTTIVGFKARAQACDLSKYFLHETLVISGLLTQKRSVRERKEEEHEERLESGGATEPMEMSLTPSKYLKLLCMSSADPQGLL